MNFKGIREIVEYLFKKAIMPKQRGGSRMKNRIAALKGIGKNARKITTEIAGNYAICVATEPAAKKKFLCVYASAKGLNFGEGAVHSRKLINMFLVNQHIVSILSKQVVLVSHFHITMNSAQIGM